MRWVKRTVDHDNPTAHHLFFGDGLGRPGSLLTVFEWTGLPAGRPGIGTVHRVGLRMPPVPDLGARRARLESAGVPVGRIGDGSIELTDPDGYQVELIVPGAAAGGAGGPQPEPAWGDVRLDHVLAGARDLQRTSEWCERVLGLERSGAGELDEDPNVPLWSFGEERSLRYRSVRLGGKPVGHLGPGTAHHIAFRVAGDGELHDWLDHLRAQDVPATQVIDRFYFRCVYFRDPDGNVFELATDGPGLALDEAPDDLGRTLRLPPWLEPSRERLVAELSEL